jgi:serine/threonine protein kinase
MLSAPVKYIIDSVVDVIGFKQSTEQSGGDFIGKGTFGCVYRPAFDVHALKNGRIKVERIDGYISKIVKRPFGRPIDQLDDIVQNQKIQDIDPERIFTLPLRSVAEFDIDSLKSDESREIVDTCNIFKPTDQLANVIIKDGGMTYDNVIEKIMRQISRGRGVQYYVNTIEQMYRSFDQLLEGLALMNEKQFIHHDIKKDNVTFDDVRSYLIDFGISTTVEEICDEMSLNLVESMSRKLENENLTFENVVDLDMHGKTASERKLISHYPPESIVRYFTFVDDPDEFIQLDNEKMIELYMKTYQRKRNEVIQCFKSLRKLTRKYTRIIRKICNEGFVVHLDDGKPPIVYSYIDMKKMLVKAQNTEDEEVLQITDVFYETITSDKRFVRFIAKLYSKFDMFGLGRVLAHVRLASNMIFNELERTNRSDFWTTNKLRMSQLNDKYSQLAIDMTQLSWHRRTVNRITDHVE